MRHLRAITFFLTLTLYILPALAEPQTDRVETFPATLDINTRTKTEPVKNTLLGMNISSFQTKRQRDLFRKFDPISMRFPSGVWGNFYDWETDTYTNHGDSHRKTNVYGPTLAKWKEIGITGGFTGLTKLHNEKKRANGKGFDVIWLYNAAYDSPAKSVARMKDRLDKGFVVRDIDLGNEQFWLSQCSSKTITPEGYLDAARAISLALKKANPEVRTSVTLSWRDRHESWNKMVADDGKYFDAISLHKYSGFDHDKAEGQQAALEDVLAARARLGEAADYVRSFAPGKPIWLTEWGINAGEGAKGAAALAMADCYLYMLENQDVFDRANWFTVNGLDRSFLIFKEKRTLLYPLRKTAYASVYEIIRDIFEDSQLLHGKMSSPKLPLGDHKIDAVSARAVVKDGKTSVFAVNLSDRPCRLTLRFDTKTHDQAITHRALAFKNLSERLVLDFEQSPLKPIKNEPGTIILPPRSVNTLTGFE